MSPNTFDSPGLAPLNTLKKEEWQVSADLAEEHTRQAWSQAEAEAAKSQANEILRANRQAKAAGAAAVGTSVPWQDRAACKGIEPAIFYPEDDEDAGPAKAICKVCPVREDCLENAIRIREKEGVRGGATEKERRSIIRNRRLDAKKAKEATQ